ncbi:hypothetical protein [Lactiplantibacillus pentosus]|uniref:hypothetical protein n=1 Tax=Lactiplantibacillus pentosus TaxID=1589 RepID=UPI0021821FF5|nr:hypothetical protein [Lactiplantibacillus pentosus]MCS8602912.1 hypothetical protein [Lactiplantibacillus pentosus]
MLKLVFIIVLIGGIWFVHSKLGVKWSSIFMGLGAAVVALVSWSSKSNSSSRKAGHDLVNRLSSLTNYELKNFINDYNNDPMERQTAHNILRSRQENNTDRY